MSLLIFIVAEVVGAVFLYAAYVGILSMVSAALAVVVMLALSFHVLAREPKPDPTSIRMAAFAAMLWYCSILSGQLFLEFRGWPTTLAAFLFTAIVVVVAAFASWSVLERPLDYDVDEAQ